MWKHGSVVLTVGHLIVRKDLRISVVNGTSLFRQCLKSFYRVTHLIGENLPLTEILEVPPAVWLLHTQYDLIGTD